MDSIESEERRGKCRGRGGGSSTFMDSIEAIDCISYAYVVI